MVFRHGLHLNDGETQILRETANFLHVIFGAAQRPIRPLLRHTPYTDGAIKAN